MAELTKAKAEKYIEENHSDCMYVPYQTRRGQIKIVNKNSDDYIFWYGYKGHYDTERLDKLLVEHQEMLHKIDCDYWAERHKTYKARYKRLAFYIANNAGELESYRESKAIDLMRHFSNQTSKAKRLMEGS
ncbi:MAG: hypothetical protein GY804_03845 [Alphaproteobacteria bacterium]|nr:hypothetical protein [Alphaproteobacteria bacterium]